MDYLFSPSPIVVDVCIKCLMILMSIPPILAAPMSIMLYDSPNPHFLVHIIYITTISIPYILCITMVLDNIIPLIICIVIWYGAIICLEIFEWWSNRLKPER
jgi:hypothetical protein